MAVLKLPMYPVESSCLMANPRDSKQYVSIQVETGRSATRSRTSPNRTYSAAHNLVQTLQALLSRWQSGVISSNGRNWTKAKSRRGQLGTV
ncbi:hypothetical protein FOQG_19447 [Fusarium oxysporum f. sp. raphani 54005]|uniref:Uncharacterized protein n=1 Tax=Fusarium oxysporum f. sp. raphani 54005 TaxID=1089458 RepID=X0BZ27_FUSOX|nr:hypothetical protein FOQG_19447 [Fusarium oxysporum f. sp. raphani 54005]